MNKFNFYLSSHLAEDSNQIAYTHRDVLTGKEINAISEPQKILADNYYIGVRLRGLKGKMLTLLDSSIKDDTLSEKKKKKALKDMTHLIFREESSHIDKVMGQVN